MAPPSLPLKYDHVKPILSLKPHTCTATVHHIHVHAHTKPQTHSDKFCNHHICVNGYRIFRFHGFFFLCNTNIYVIFPCRFLFPFSQKYKNIHSYHAHTIANRSTNANNIQMHVPIDYDKINQTIKKPESMREGERIQEDKANQQ